MSKKLTIITLIIISVVGSLFTVLGSNMFFSDVANMSATKDGLLVTLPALTFAALFPMAFLYVTRLYLRPKAFRSHTKLYTIIAVAISGVGLLTSLLTPLIYYGSFTKPYPFPGYSIIFMTLHLLVVAGGIYVLLMLKKRPADEVEKFHVNAGHVFKTIGWYLFIALVFNRFGMFVGSPIYIQWRTFGITWPYYLYLLVPAFVGVVKMLILLGVITCKKAKLILVIATYVCNLALFLPIVIIGIGNTGFISAVSPAAPLERLASMPVEILIHFASMVAVSTILLVQTLKKKAN